MRAAGDAQAFRHPHVGLLSTHLMQLRMIDRPSLYVVIHRPSAADDVRKLERLGAKANWSAVVCDCLRRVTRMLSGLRLIGNIIRYVVFDDRI
ncbi:hypothetical protein [Mycobacterium branderi]|uniref:hypothetical protein n=1 Tax=Mycobacterium branderi TaxID=43348 RepID=UPI003557FB04